jgi:hypothetical protein
MGQEAVVVKNGLRLCGTGAARGSSPILQVSTSSSASCVRSGKAVLWSRNSLFYAPAFQLKVVDVNIFFTEN